MRILKILYAQHLGWAFKRHWQFQGKKVVNKTVKLNNLKKLGINVKDVDDLLRQKSDKTLVESLAGQPKQYVKSSPNLHCQSGSCYIYGNDSILLQGMKQAQVLTKTLAFTGLPRNLEKLFLNLQIPYTLDRSIVNIISTAQALDAEYIKLQTSSLSENLSYNFSREYGISYQRRSRLLMSRLLLECEKISSNPQSFRLSWLYHSHFSATVPCNKHLIKFNMKVPYMLTAAKPIEPIQGVLNGDLPVMFPLKYTLSLPKIYINTNKTFYPMANRVLEAYPHTIFSFHDKELLVNRHGTAATPQQIQSRTLISAFVVAAARANQLYGDSFQGTVPTPIVVQSIQTDGRTFSFGVFQLNTLALNEETSLKNYWFYKENINLFNCCSYKIGQLCVDGYNKNVFRYLNAMYHNV